MNKFEQTYEKIINEFNNNFPPLQTRETMLRDRISLETSADLKKAVQDIYFKLPDNMNHPRKELKMYLEDELKKSKVY